MTSTQIALAVAPAEAGRELFATRLRTFGSALAVATPEGESFTYEQLADRVDEAALVLGRTRRLVLIEARNDVDSLVAYLAAIAGGHVALLSDAGNARAIENLVANYAPDIVMSGGTIDERRYGTAHELHEDLALLLSTSGSTGSPKLVRLSYDNLQSNALSIAQYLDIRSTDRAAMTLPMHYCYGLSVVNSNLSQGAAILMSDYSVVDDCFWKLFGDFGGTSLHGVPLTFDLLDKVNFASKDVPSLRYVTQAGGRLNPERVASFAQLGRTKGWDFYVMYGQTEATARMAYLPPDFAVSNASTIGIPIPGGSFELVGGDNVDEGELVYRGPNVMLGYAENPGDLALGRTIDRLATGDIARYQDNGLLEVIGRKSRFVKIAGLRIDLDQVEATLSSADYDCLATGDDTELIVATTASKRRVQSLVHKTLSIPRSAVHVHAVDELPRLASGKPDYQKVKGLNAPVAEPVSIRGAFEANLGRERVADSDTFVSLGGDSLSYVAVSVQIEKRLGFIPSDLQRLTVAELEKLAPRRRSFGSMETTVVFRAVAICLVVGSHVGVSHVLGGALVLLLAAGWSFARFVLSDNVESPSNRILRSTMLIAIPSCLWISYRDIAQADVKMSNVLLINNYFGSGSWGYWYIETLVQALLALAALFAIPKVRALERRRPFEFALGVLAVAVGLRCITATPAGAWEPFIVTHIVVWTFTLGWVAQRAVTVKQKLLVMALAVPITLGSFSGSDREALLLGGLVLLTFVPSLPVARWLIPVISTLSSASLYIYLSHYATYPALLQHVSGWPTVLISISIGVAMWLVVRRVAKLQIAKRPVPKNRPFAVSKFRLISS